MDDLLNKTRYNNLIRPATSSLQLISIQLQLSLAQLISVVGAGGGRLSGLLVPGWESGGLGCPCGSAQTCAQNPRSSIWSSPLGWARLLS